MDILEKITKTSGEQCNRLIKKALKEVQNPELKGFLDKKWEEIITCKKEDEQAQRRLETKRTLKEYIRTQELKIFTGESHFKKN